VADDVDGLLVEPGDVGALADALRRLADSGLVQRLREGVTAPDLDTPWDRYLQALLGKGVA
jgi:glycosyltransferase involved in cell wall biosynthesis